MKALLVHNHYQREGGEDRVFADESSMLAAHRDEVTHYTLHNDSISPRGALGAAAVAMWNRSAYRDVRALLRETDARVMHCHNTFPLVSPAVYYAARAEGVPVVQTLHNYRLMCPGVVMFRDGRPCDACVGHLPWRGVMHGCYRGSRGATAAAAGVVLGHRGVGTWQRLVDVYIAPSEFTKRMYVEGGWPAESVVVKPHFVQRDPGVGEGDGGYALYVGRLSAEKGVGTLLEAWRQLGATVPLRIVGDGPLADEVAHAAAESPSIEWLGHRSPEDVARLMGRALFAVCPSACFETFGRAVIEAFAAGVPVIAANIGALAELVDHGRTGRLFTACDASSLVAEVRAFVDDRDGIAAMRREARAEFEAKYTMARNYEMLQRIYESAGARRS